MHRVIWGWVIGNTGLPGGLAWVNEQLFAIYLGRSFELPFVEMERIVLFSRMSRGRHGAEILD